MDQQQLISNACLNCPRCNSTNTKFCYYNNYSLSQPRHFCKACKRYWTRGGALRNVPVGGACRKNNKRVKSRVATPSLTPLPSSTSTTVSATIDGASNNALITPLLFTSYNDINMMTYQQQQPCNNSDNNATNGSFLSRLQNVTPLSCTSLNQADQLLERMFQFQTMQQQELTSTTVNDHHHNMRDQQQQEEQRWRNTSHDPRGTSMYTTSHWPQNHLANINMDG